MNEVEFEGNEWKCQRSKALGMCDTRRQSLALVGEIDYVTLSMIDYHVITFFSGKIKK